MERVIEEFARTTEEIVTLAELRERLLSGKQIRIKYGVDVTAPMMHIGHAVNLWMMRALQDLGHKVVFLLGDFTTRIGDPTGRSKTRPVLPEEEISANAEAFIEQVGQVLRTDSEVVEIRRNSEWFGDLPTQRFIELLQMVTHDKLISREMFRRRMEAGTTVYMHELTYPIIQGYDSVALESDLTIIGSDQLFNEMMGRFYQSKFAQQPQVIITTKITPGIDGKEKQSKSLGNYVGLNHDARDKFGRVMSIPDTLIRSYLEVYTELPMKRVEELAEQIDAEPMDVKKELAEAIVSRYHGADVAAAERRWFEDVFSGRQAPADSPKVVVPREEVTALAVVRGCLPEGEFSNSQIRRLFQQNAVRLDDKKIDDPYATLAIQDGGSTLRVGQRRWFRLFRESGP